MKKKIKILVLFGSPYLYGSEKANIDVFTALKEKYNDIDALFLTDIYDGESVVHPYLKKLKHKYIPVHYHYRFMKNMSIFEWLKKFSKIALGTFSFIRIFRQYRPTHIYISKPEYFLNFSPALFFIKKPIIYRIGDSPIQHSLVHRQLWSYIVKKTSKIICVSNFIGKQVEMSGAKKSKIEVIYSRPHERKNKVELVRNKDDDFFTVLYVGQIGKHKGLDLFVEAAIDLCQKYKNIRFLIAGKVDENDHFSQDQIASVVNAKLSQNIQFLGYVSNVDDLYVNSNLHICPSVYDEPLANVLIDAKKHAIPSIIFDVGGLPEIIKHENNGYICKEKTSLALEKSIEYYYLHQDVCEKMGENALNSLEELKIDQFSERWLNVFESTC